MYFVYIITNKNNTTLYIGVTNNLIKRVYEHKNKLYKESFSAKYNLKKLVYYEITDDILSAIQREKILKKWKRDWKFKLISDFNSNWNDLYIDLI